MKSKKMLALCLMITCGVSTVSAEDKGLNILRGQGCETLNFNQIKQAINDREQMLIKDPFGADRCVPISFKANDVSSLSVSDFGGSKGIHGVYQAFVKSEDMMVTEVKTRGNKIYKFMKINYDDEHMKSFRDAMDKGKDNFAAMQFEQWMFYHEMFHLFDDVSTKRPNRKQKQRVEANADLSGALLMSVEHDFTVEQTLDLLKNIENGRRNSHKRGAIDHYNKRMFHRLMENAKELKQFSLNGKKLEEMGALQLQNVLENISYLANDMITLDNDEFIEKYKDSPSEIASFTFSKESEEEVLLSQEKRKSFESILEIAQQRVGEQRHKFEKPENELIKKVDNQDVSFGM